MKNKSILDKPSGAADHGDLSGLADDDHPQYIKEAEIDAKGDLLVGSADDTIARLAIGTNTHVLVADSGEPLGVKWSAAGAGVTDHGALTGLADDDHSQYHNNARGDTRYYTKAEVDIQAIKWALVFGD